MTAIALAAAPSGVAAEAIAPTPEPEQAALASSIRAPGTQSPRELRAPKSAEGSPEKDRSDDFEVLAGEPVSRRGVQHLGASLLAAMVAEIGHYERMKALLPASSFARCLRVTLDSVLKEAGTKDLVRHCGEYKMLIGTLRIAGSNAVTQLARWLAPHINRASGPEPSQCIWQHIRSSRRNPRQSRPIGRPQ